MNAEVMPMNPTPTPAAVPAFIRPLGRMERSIWFCDQCSPTNIGLGCELDGAFTDDALRRALRWCQIRHPLLRSVIRPAGRALALHAYAPDQAPPIPLEVRSGTAADEDAVMMQALQPPLASAGGLMARAILLRWGDQRASLAIVFSHVVGDGFSAVVLLQDLVNFLGREAQQGTVPDPEPLPFPPPAEAGIAREHRGWSGFKKLMAVQKEIAAELKRHGAKPSPVRVQADPPPGGRPVQCRNFSLTEPQTRAVLARARREQVSSFALLGAALLDALQPLLVPTKKDPGGDRVVSFGVPVDLRPFLEHAVKDHFGFYASAVNQLHLVRDANDLVALAKEVHTALKRDFLQKKVHLHTTPLLADFLSWRWLFPLNRKGAGRVAKLTAGMFKSCATSLTFLNDSIRIDDAPGIRIARPRGHISPSIMGTGLFCALLYQNVLSVHLTYNQGQLSDADAALLTGRFQANLLALANPGDAATPPGEPAAANPEEFGVLAREA